MEEQIKERWGDRKNLEIDLADRGVPIARLRDKFRLHFLIQRLLEADYYKSDSFVRPAEVREYYQQHIEEYAVPGAMALDHIDYKKADYGSAEKARAAAEKALGDLRGGKPFVEVVRATQYDFSGKEQDGAWSGVHSPEDLPKATRAVVAKLAPGEVSGVIEEDKLCRIVRLVSVRQASHKSFEEVEDEIQRKLEDMRRDDRLKDLRARLRTQATIKVWAK
jgi:parvulin-like peptidyl-prolyl isomerase